MTNQAPGIKKDAASLASTFVVHCVKRTRPAAICYLRPNDRTGR
jgi:hypothetical protein